MTGEASWESLFTDVIVRSGKTNKVTPAFQPMNWLLFGYELLPLRLFGGPEFFSNLRDSHSEKIFTPVSPVAGFGIVLIEADAPYFIMGRCLLLVRRAIKYATVTVF